MLEADSVAEIINGYRKVSGSAVSLDGYIVRMMFNAFHCTRLYNNSMRNSSVPPSSRCSGRDSISHYSQSSLSA